VGLIARTVQGSFTAVADKEQIKQWISEFETVGEQTVRDSINFRADITMRGEEKLSTALTWLRDQERKREAQAIAAFNHIRRTFWAAVVGAIFAAGTTVIVVVVAVMRLKH
jgi:hypothetical protein